MLGGRYYPMGVFTPVYPITQKLRPNLKIHPTKISKVGTFSLKQVLSSMPTFISWYLVAFELFMSQEWHSAYFCTDPESSFYLQLAA